MELKIWNLFCREIWLLLLIQSQYRFILKSLFRILILSFSNYITLCYDMSEQSILCWHNNWKKILFHILSFEGQLLLKEIKVSPLLNVKSPLWHFLNCVCRWSRQLKSAGHPQTSTPRLRYAFVRCQLLTKYIQQQCRKIITAQTTLMIITTQLKHSAHCSVKVPSGTE